MRKRSTIEYIYVQKMYYITYVYTRTLGGNDGKIKLFTFFYRTSFGLDFYKLSLTVKQQNYNLFIDNV